MPPLAFPSSSAPGAAPGEGSGRIVNAYAIQDGEAVVYLPAPGLVPYSEGIGESVRAMLLVGTTLYVAVAEKLRRIMPDATVQDHGTLPGSELITMARNNAATPSIVIVTDTGVYQTNGTVFGAYPDTDVGAPNSVSFLDAYFLFTYSDGTIRASDLNSTNINTLSNVKAEAKPDGIIRGVVKGRQFLAFGSNSVEFYSNVGTSPFPLARDEVVDVGLFGRWAIAGFEDGWDGPLIMVAADGTVRRWDGYTASRISTSAVERSISTVVNPEALTACVYTFGGNSVWSMSGPNFTWDYHVVSGLWVERASYGLRRWRGRVSARISGFGRWLIGDIASSTLMAIYETARLDGNDPIVFEVEGIGPANARLGDLRLYFSTGQGREDAALPNEQEPTVLVDWSSDGGASYGQPVQCSLGRQGQYRRYIALSRLGTSREQPIRVRVRVSDPVPFQYRGGEIRRVSKMGRG